MGYVVFTFPHVRGTLWLCGVHIRQLMPHSPFFTLPFILHLCYKSLAILQRVTKSQKVHFLSHDGLQNFTTSNFVNIGPRYLPQGVLKVFLHTGLNVYKESSGDSWFVTNNLLVYYKLSQTRSISCTNSICPLSFIRVCAQY